MTLAHIPATAADRARSDAAQAAQVVSLCQARDRRAACRAITDADADALREAVAIHGTIKAAGRSLGWPDGRAGTVAHRAGIKGQPAAIKAAQMTGRFSADHEGHRICDDILHCSPRWRAAYGEAWAAAKDAGHDDGWATYTGIKAADAYCVLLAGEAR